MKIVAIIPAKGTSQRLENKNLYKIGTTTLVERACEKLLNSKLIDAVYLDTESESVKLHCQHLEKRGLKILSRPAQLATNDTGANEMLMYALHSIEECDLLIQTFATSPLITINTIDNCIEKFLESGNDYDSFFTVSKMQEYFWNENEEPINFSTVQLPNSFQLAPMYMETHGLYGVFSNSLLANKTRVGKKPMMITIPKIESFDIDDKEDLEIIEHIITSQELG